MDWANDEFLYFSNQLGYSITWYPCEELLHFTYAWYC
jgi:hypothetical protein